MFIPAIPVSHAISAMNEEAPTVCSEVRHGTDEYRQTVALRDELLRRPLGLKFSPEELAQEKDSFHLACRQGGTLAACLVLEPMSARRIQMRQLAVAADFQGRGIGRSLMGYSESFARQRGYREIVMHAREEAVGFYEKLGYRREGGRFTEVTIPHFVMRKTLAGGGEAAGGGGAEPL